MPLFADYLLDLALAHLDTNANRMDICSTAPATYTEATSTYTLGSATPSIGAPTDRTPNGRKVVLAAVAAGTVTATGTANYYALTETGASRLLVWGTVTPQVVTSGNTWTSAAVDIGIPDAA
jgi:hypothetical protein